MEPFPGNKLLAKFILIFLLLLLYLFYRPRRAGLRPHLRFLSLGALCLAMLAILFPDVTTRISHLLGVGRGVDLILYLMIVFLLFVVTGLRLRLGQVQRNLTLLTRQIAFLQARPAERQKKEEPQETPAVSNDEPPSHS